MKTLKCNTCGNDFQTKKACKSRVPKYCSKECYAKSLVKIKICPHCSKEFPSDPNTKYCSVECYKNNRVSRAGQSLSPEWRKALSEGRRKSDKCKGENLYNWKGGKATLSKRMNLHSYKRKSSQSIAIDPEFLKILLAAQDNKCFYCERDLTDYKAIEHLTPLSKGGDNQPYNLVYSCKICNSIKRDKTLEDLAIKTGKFYLLDKFDQIYASTIN